MKQGHDEAYFIEGTKKKNAHNQPIPNNLLIPSPSSDLTQKALECFQPDPRLRLLFHSLVLYRC